LDVVINGVISLEELDDTPRVAAGFFLAMYRIKNIFRKALM
jgi:hypothetical protein